MDSVGRSTGGGGPGRSFMSVGDFGPKDKLGLLWRVFGAAHDGFDPGARERVETSSLKAGPSTGSGFDSSSGSASLLLFAA
jgi:hypothetical protein